MAGEAEQLKAIIANIDDLARYQDQDQLLDFAVNNAISRINARRGYTGEGYEKQYRPNVINGAIDYLSRLGGGEFASFSENGVSASYKGVESWLEGVVPLLKTYA